MLCATGWKSRCSKSIRNAVEVAAPTLIRYVPGAFTPEKSIGCTDGNFPLHEPVEAPVRPVSTVRPRLSTTANLAFAAPPST